MVKSIKIILNRCEGDELKANTIITALLKDWYVECSVTGETIPVADLHYWTPDGTRMYKDAETAMKDTT